MIGLVGLTPDDDVGSKFTVPSDSAYQLFGVARITMPPGQRWRQIGGYVCASTMDRCHTK